MDPRPGYVEKSIAKMKGENLSDAAIAAFARSLQAVGAGEQGVLREGAIVPVVGLPMYSELRQQRPSSEVLKKTVLCKLNGGLGTSMGLARPKSLLPIKGGNTFLDLIIKQIQYFSTENNMPLRFILMNSFSTSADTREFLQTKYPALAARFPEIELMQNKVPKVLQDGLEPATFPQDPENEWCPPGHGDLYAALYGSEMLDRLLADGYEYLFVSNSDNLGASLDLRILSYFSERKLDFLMEVCERTESDRKGGHLARSATTNKLLLRESAQCAPSDEKFFQDVSRHRYFNTNSLWINLRALKIYMDSNGGVMQLPVIRNSKTVDPVDPSSPKVFQLETAMGTAISLFQNVEAIVVPRSRFSPVKSCADLLALRSDCYTIAPDFGVVLHEERNGVPPKVLLDSSQYKYIDQLDNLIPRESSVPRILRCSTLQVDGKFAFAEGVTVIGDVKFCRADKEAANRKVIPRGVYEQEPSEGPLVCFL